MLKYRDYFKKLIVLLLISNLNCLRIENLKEISKDSTSISLEWSISSADYDLLINKLNATNWIGFKIKYFTDKLQYTPILLKSIDHKKFRLDNLKSATEYKIQVSAYDSLENEGPASSLLIVKTNEAGSYTHSFSNFLLYIIYIANIFKF